MMHILDKASKMMLFLCFFFLFSAHATSVTLPYNFTAGSPISASQMMGNFASITSALSSTVSSPWVASSSNIYFATGSVGIGSSAPAHTLDVSGDAAVSGNITCNNGKYLKSANGYAALPGGLLLQWGTYTYGTMSGTPNAAFTITFPIAFSSAVYNVTATLSDQGPGISGATQFIGAGVGWGAMSATSFVVGVKTSNGSVLANTFYWTAIGPL